MSASKNGEPVIPADAIETVAGNSRFFAALQRYVESERYNDEHPDDAHGGDELDYCRDLIAEAALTAALPALREWVLETELKQVGWLAAGSLHGMKEPLIQPESGDRPVFVLRQEQP